MQLTRNTLPPILASAKLEHLPNVLAKHRDLKQQPTQLIIFLLHTSLETAISFRQQRHDAFILRMHVCVFLENLISKKKKQSRNPSSSCYTTVFFPMPNLKAQLTFPTLPAFYLL